MTIKDDDDFVTITYDFRSMPQTSEMPHPEVIYEADKRITYLEKSYPEINTILQLLCIAFHRGLLFTVGRSLTRNKDDVVIWSGVHQKTAKTGIYGYPDPSFYDRLRLELAQKGVTEDSIIPFFNNFQTKWVEPISGKNRRDQYLIDNQTAIPDYIPIEYKIARKNAVKLESIEYNYSKLYAYGICTYGSGQITDLSVITALRKMEQQIFNKISPLTRFISELLSSYNNDDYNLLKWYMDVRGMDALQKLNNTDRIKDSDFLNFYEIGSLISRSPELPFDLLTYRGVPAEYNFVAGREIGYVLHRSPEPYSVSVSLEMAELFTGATCCIYEIIIPKGTQVAFSARLLQIILPGDSALRLDSLPFTPNKRKSYRMTYIPPRYL
jgi:deltex-like protein